MVGTFFFFWLLNGWYMKQQGLLLFKKVHPLIPLQTIIVKRNYVCFLRKRKEKGKDPPHPPSWNGTKVLNN